MQVSRDREIQILATVEAAVAIDGSLKRRHAGAIPGRRQHRLFFLPLGTLAVRAAAIIRRSEQNTQPDPATRSGVVDVGADAKLNRPAKG